MLFTPLSFSQGIDTLEVEFIRQYSEGEKDKETTKGKIYYKAPAWVFIKVNHPLNQWIIIRKNEMLIYYPDDKKAFRIQSNLRALFSLPFFQVLICTTKEDFGLSELGYTMNDYKIEESSLISDWRPPESIKAFLGTITLVFQDNKITLFESKKQNEEIFSRSTFSKHVLFGTINFPLEVSTEKYFESYSVLDHIVYISPKFNIPISKEIMNFNIPETVHINTIEW